jgi:hypothetical protein
MIRALAAALMLAALPAQAQQAASGAGAVLRALDKVDGSTTDMQVPTGYQARIFGLQVAVGDCRYPAGDPAGDAYAYLQITNDDEETGALFTGWMIASSPALNALDHSRYDVWVLRCITD